MAVDASGHALFSTHPSGGSGSWSHPARVDGSNPLTGVSCPTTHFCVAVDANGNVLTSTRPTRGAKGWSRPVHIDSVRSIDGGYAGLLGISCPTVSLCVAVDAASSGDVLSTTRPAGGARAWRMARLGVLLTSVSCRATNLCVAAGAAHVVTADPTGGRRAWHVTGAPAGGGVLSAIDCPTTALCLGVGFSNAFTGLANATGTPHGGARTWRTAAVVPTPPPDGSELLDAVGCAGTKLCVALDTADNAYVSTAPLRGRWGPLRAIRPGSTSEQNAVSCTLHLCMVVDSAGVETTGAVYG